MTTLKPITDPELIRQLEITNQFNSNGMNEQNDNQYFSSHPILKNIGEFISNHPLLSNTIEKSSNIADTFNKGFESTRLPALAGGLLQGASDVGISSANIIPSLLGKEKIHHMNLRQYLPSDFLTNSAFMTGELAGSGIPEVGLFNKISKLLPAASGSKKLLQKIGTGSALGAITGEEAPFGRMGGAAIGGALPIPFELTNKSMIKDVLETGNIMKDKYKGLYDNLWKEANKRGLGDEFINIPEIDIDTLRKYSTKKSLVGVEDFLKKPTIDLAHKAKSDLLAIQRKLDKMTTIRTAERKQAEAVSNAITNIQNNMFKTSEGKIDKDLLNEYNKIQKGYKNEVIPYSTNKSILKYKSKDITEKELIDALSKGSFSAKRGNHHLIGMKGNIGSAVKYGLPAIGIEELLRSNYNKHE